MPQEREQATWFDQEGFAVRFGWGPNGLRRWEHPPGVLTLSPASLMHVEPGTRLVLPSPNGSALTFGAEAAVFEDARPELRDRLMMCGSGRQLIDRGSVADVDLAAMLDASDVAPTLDGATLVSA